jgi:hypothetical protein
MTDAKLPLTYGSCETACASVMALVVAVVVVVVAAAAV